MKNILKTIMICGLLITQVIKSEWDHTYNEVAVFMAIGAVSTVSVACSQHKFTGSAIIAATTITAGTAAYLLIKNNFNNQTAMSAAACIAFAGFVALCCLPTKKTQQINYRLPVAPTEQSPLIAV